MCIEHVNECVQPLAQVHAIDSKLLNSHPAKKCGGPRRMRCETKREKNKYASSIEVNVFGSSTVWLHTLLDGRHAASKSMKKKKLHHVVWLAFKHVRINHFGWHRNAAKAARIAFIHTWDERPIQMTVYVKHFLCSPDVMRGPWSIRGKMIAHIGRRWRCLGGPSPRTFLMKTH